MFTRVHAEAPGTSLEWQLPNAQAPLAVADGRIDLCHVGGDARLPDGLDTHIAQPFSWVTLVRKDHPAIANWGIAAWTKWPHIVVNMANNVPNPVEEATRKINVKRTIGALIPDFSGVAPLLARTNMLGTFPPLLMVDEMDIYGLRALKPPVPLAPFPVRFFWSSRLANDPGNRWIRSLVIETYTELQKSAEKKLAEIIFQPKKVRR